MSVDEPVRIPVVIDASIVDMLMALLPEHAAKKKERELREFTDDMVRAGAER